MIPLIIIYGYKIRRNVIGWTARRCERCECVQPFECCELLKSEHIYYIHGKEKNVGLVLACDFCQMSVGVPLRGPERDALRIEPHWTRTQGLQTLVDHINPALGRVPTNTQPTARALHALLESANERASAVRTDIKRGIILGGSAGAICLTPCMLLLRLFITEYMPDALGSAMMGVTLGGLFGAVVGACLEQRRRAHAAVLDVLTTAGERHGLSIGTLRAALATHPRRLSRVARVLAGLDESDGGGAHTNARPQTGGNRNVCPHCQFINFTAAPACKRCGQVLGMAASVAS